MTAFNKFHF